MEAEKIPAPIDFWQKYHDIRRKQMPGAQILYASMDDMYRRMRESFHRHWGPHMDKRIPDSSIKAYNGLFASSHKQVARLLQTHRVPLRSRRLADLAYGVRLKRGDTLRDLLKLDVFGEKTVNQDIHPDFVFGNLRAQWEKNPVLVSDTNHFFFHRPQRTEHIFLHEIIVGFLLNEVEQDFIYTRHDLPLDSNDYPPYAAYALTRLAKLLKMNHGQVVALHFEDSATVNRILPKFVKDLMLAASHIYWFLDLYSKWSNKHVPADLLRYVYNFFVVPCLERQMEEGALRLRRDAGRYVEGVFVATILKGFPNYGEGVSDSEVVRALFILVENLWRKPPRRRRRF
jgi:hypothetical protein